MTRASSLRALAVALAVAITGCQDPYARDPTESASPPPAEPSTAPSDDSQPGPPDGPTPNSAARPAHSAPSAARSFATRWVNWDWRSAASQQRTLARLATRGLARQLRANANSARIDATLARNKPGSRGSIAAIDLNARKAEATGLVVTREQTYTDGRADLGGRHCRVYLIRLTHQQNGWGVSAWEPQP